MISRKKLIGITKYNFKKPITKQNVPENVKKFVDDLLKNLTVACKFSSLDVKITRTRYKQTLRKFWIL